ncbi:hypothetical protein E2C01_085949 [Portunus trituberculatus]|uniref:Uncharacterized protein n=1 Tax=Portunus trituberculatus TaxID=210409 RepID=A0A5B7J8D7_PORTR|nr:hypothetical protein [Portunus trituberculatus]
MLVFGVTFTLTRRPAGHSTVTDMPAMITTCLIFRLESCTVMELQFMVCEYCLCARHKPQETR